MRTNFLFLLPTQTQNVQRVLKLLEKLKQNLQNNEEERSCLFRKDWNDASFFLNRKNRIFRSYSFMFTLPNGSEVDGAMPCIKYSICLSNTLQIFNVSSIQDLGYQVRKTVFQQNDKCLLLTFCNAIGKSAYYWFILIANFLIV